MRILVTEIPAEPTFNVTIEGFTRRQVQILRRIAGMDIVIPEMLENDKVNGTPMTNHEISEILRSIHCGLSSSL